MAKVTPKKLVEFSSALGRDCGSLRFDGVDGDGLFARTDDRGRSPARSSGVLEGMRGLAAGGVGA